MKDTYKKAICVAACVLGTAVAAWTVWRMLPLSADDMRRSTAVVSETTWYEVNIDGKPLLYFRNAEGDSALSGVCTMRDSVAHRRYATGVWVNKWFIAPSCKGRIITSGLQNDCPLDGSADSTVVRLCREDLNRLLRTLKHQKSELDYYMRVHGVQDYGYQEAAALSNRINRRYAEAERTSRMIDSLALGKHRFAIKTRHQYAAVYRSAEGKLMRTPLVLVSNNRATATTLLRTADGITPEGVHSLSLLPWNVSADGEIRAAGVPSIGEKGLECDTVSPRIFPGTITQGKKHNLPQLLAGNGAPVFTAKGRFIGVVNGDTIVPRKTLRTVDYNEE